MDTVDTIAPSNVSQTRRLLRITISVVGASSGVRAALKVEVRRPCSRPTATPTLCRAGECPATRPAWRSRRDSCTYLESNTHLAALLHRTGQDTYVLSGSMVTDPEALGQMDIPGHETCVEVGKVREGGADEAAEG